MNRFFSVNIQYSMFSMIILKVSVCNPVYGLHLTCVYPRLKINTGAFIIELCLNVPALFCECRDKFYSFEVC